MNEHDDETDAYAMTVRRIAAHGAAQRWHPCVTCDGTGYAQNAPFVPKHALTSSECPACQGTGTTKLAPFVDAYPVRFGGHALAPPSMVRPAPVTKRLSSPASHATKPAMSRGSA